jgi:DNA-binding GntR family transcriptional regulator
MTQTRVDKVWEAILTMAERDGTPPTQRQVAAHLGLSPFVVNGVFRSLVDSGRIEYLTHSTYAVVGAKWEAPSR